MLFAEVAKNGENEIQAQLIGFKSIIPHYSFILTLSFTKHIAYATPILSNTQKHLVTRACREG